MSRITGLCALLVVLAACQHQPAHVVALPTVAPPPSLPVIPTYAERRILLRIEFALDQYSIAPESLDTLNNLASALKDDRLRGASYEINGHTDLRGRFNYNIALSARRAKSVSDFLRLSGVQIPPIRAQGFGPLQLLYPDQPFNSANRRVEVIATGP